MLDVELAFHVFHTDQEAMVLQELGLGYHLKELVEEHMEFFKSKERKQKFKQLIVKGDEHHVLRCKILAVIFNTESINLVNFIHSYGLGIVDDKAGFDKQLERYNLNHFFWDEIARVYNYQSGISYENLFGAYLIGATEVKLVDPYIRQPFQLRNFMEFVKLLVDQKKSETELKLHLVTTCDEEFMETTQEAFDIMAYSVESLGIILSYEFDDFIHDRFIHLDNGWKIILGRGLDIWQKNRVLV